MKRKIHIILSILLILALAMSSLGMTMAEPAQGQGTTPTPQGLEIGADETTPPPTATDTADGPEPTPTPAATSPAADPTPAPANTAAQPVRPAALTGAVNPSAVITAFNPTPYSNSDDPGTHYIVVDKGTAQYKIPLPGTLKATAQGGEADAYTVSVTQWDCVGTVDNSDNLVPGGGYDPQTPGVYRFAPTLELGEATLADGLAPPTVDVAVTMGLGIRPLANGTIDITGMASVSDIQTAIQNEIDDTAAGTVTVSGSFSGADTALMLTIPTGVKVEWGAAYSGSIGSGDALIALYDSGTFEVSAGGSVENGGAGHGIVSSYAGMTVNVNGGTVTAGNTAILSSVNTSVDVTGGTVSGDAGIYTNGSVTVSGGVVQAAGSGDAIHSINGTVTVSGGTVQAAGSGSAIRASGRVTMSGGTVSAATGYAILTRGINSVNVSGGFVFAYGSDITGTGDVINTDGTLSVSGTGVVCAWDETQGTTTYIEESATDLIFHPNSASAAWGRSGTQSGIRYANGANTGFFEVSGVTVNAPTLQDKINDPAAYSTGGTGTAVDPYVIEADDETITAGITVADISSGNAARHVKITGSAAAAANATLLRGVGCTDDLFTVPAGSSLTLTNITLDGNGGNITSDGSLVLNRGTLTVGSGAALINNKTSTSTYGGGGVYNLGGTFTMTGGKISGNASDGYYGGGGVFNDYDGTTVGTFNMTGGEISGNFATDGAAFSIGGGVLNRDSAFVMTGGEISNNSAELYGGGVYNSIGTFDMSGGKISGNSADLYGGGVCNSSCTASMTGGEISGNSSGTHGGGVFNDASSTLDLSGGTFSDNISGARGGAIYNSGTLIVSGANITMTGNSAADSGHMVYNGSSKLIQSGTGSVSLTYLSGAGIYTRPGQTVSLDATLTINDDIAITGQDVSFYVGGVFVGKSAADEGYADLSYMSTSPGLYPVTGDYAGMAANSPINTINGFVRVGAEDLSLTGPTDMTLTQGYAAASSDAFTVTGDPAPTVTIDNNYGNKITWNAAAKKLDIAPGLAAGSYPITLTANNGILSGYPSGTFDVTHAFTLTVNASPLTCTITYNANGGSGSMTDGMVAQGGNYTIAQSAFTRRGHTFTGWNTAADGSGTAYADGATIQNVQGDITLYAQWKESGGQTPYSVLSHFGTWTGSGTATAKVNADYSKFIRLLLSSNVVDPSNYVKSDGSTVIILKESYLKTLANDTYTFRAEFTDGYADLTLTVNVPEPDDAVDVTGVKLNKAALTLTLGKSETLTATVSPDNATDKGVTWKSSDTSIATVDENGLVKGVKAGKATITATTSDGGYTATCEVTVTDAAGLPQTGDSGNMMLWMITGLSSILAGLCLLIWRKRQQLKENAL